MDLSKFIKEGRFLMLALDHQEHFKKMVNQDSPNLVTAQEIISLKAQIINALKDEFTAILIDEVYGLPAYKVNKPYLLRVEKSGFIERNGIKTVELEHTVESLKLKGAAGVKLLISYDPFNKNSISELEKARLVMKESQKYNMPFFLEILTSSILADISKGEMIVKTLEKFISEGVRPDVFKLEYPKDASSCYKVTQTIAPIPWILLSGGTDFSHFKEELRIASLGSASGFLAGRAVWQDIALLNTEARRDFIENEMVKRFHDISQIMLSHS